MAKEQEDNKSYPKILVGEDDFKSLLLSSDIFVDKSLLIKEVIEDSSKVLLIARPRRWGKSLNMSMLGKFFEIEVDKEGNRLAEELNVNSKLFAGGEIELGLTSGKTKTLPKLKIANYLDAMSDYQGQFPVISISFKDVKGNSYQEIESGIRNQITKLYAKYKYLAQYLDNNNQLLTKDQQQQLHHYFNGNFDKIGIKESLVFLSVLLYQHFNRKVYILIDEYDTPINNSYLKFGDQKEEFDQVLEIFRGMFGAALKSNHYLEKGVITGIMRIAKANLFSDLNNVREYTLLDHRFAKYYGFTQEEVDELFSKTPTKTSPEQIKNWYNGYTFGGEVIYNPWSIMVCLSNDGKLDHYWLDSGGTGLVDKALLSDDLQEDLQALLEGKGIIKKLYQQISFPDIEDNPNIFYSLLVFAGYLNPILANDDEEDPRYRLTIPNKELRHIYVERVIGWVSKKLKIKISDYDDFISLLLDEKLPLFEERLQHYLLQSTSYYDLSRERDYHNLMGGILSPLARKYHIESNKESGEGRFDHLLIPLVGKGSTAFIFEYKVARKASELTKIAALGLKQINSRNYAISIKQHQQVEKLLKISIAFCGKSVKMLYQLEES